MDEIDIFCYWATQNAPIHQDVEVESERSSFRRYLMTNIGPIAYIYPRTYFAEYSDCFNKEGAKFTWNIIWLLDGEKRGDGTAYGDRTLSQVEEIVIKKLTRTNAKK